MELKQLPGAWVLEVFRHGGVDLQLLAKQLLSQTNVKLYEISQKTGFTNQSSFTRFFIRCNQLAPQDYRQLKRAKN